MFEESLFLCAHCGYRHQHVDSCYHNEGDDEGAGDSAVWVFHFLRGGGDNVQADEAEEDGPGGSSHTRHTHGGEGVIVAGFEAGERHHSEHEEDSNFQNNHDGVRARRLASTRHQEATADCYQHYCRQVNGESGEGAVTPGGYGEIGG